MHTAKVYSVSTGHRLRYKTCKLNLTAGIEAAARELNGAKFSCFGRMLKILFEFQYYKESPIKHRTRVGAGHLDHKTSHAEYSKILFNSVKPFLC